MKNATARAEWSYLGEDTLRLASYWVRRWSALYETNYDHEHAADAIAIAYGRYTKWRAKNTPEDVLKIVSSMIRNAAREAVKQRFGKETESMPEDRKAPEDTEPLRIVQAIGRLPEDLQTVAIAIVTMQGDLSTRDIATETGLSQSTASRRLRQLAGQPAIHDLQLCRFAETVSKML